MNPFNVDISVVLPCRNEEESLEICIATIRKVFKDHHLVGQIIVSDSSDDRSPQIALDLGVELVKHDKVGYGIAYLEGFRRATGRYIFLADCDNTYDFNEIPKFIKYLNEGYGLVIGDRFTGQMDKGAMPWSHRYIGNPILSYLFRIFFHTKLRDIHCGMRAIKKELLDQLDLKTTGMEFASEMIIKAIKNKLKIKELPINYHRRQGKSKLKSMSDGWRHLRFMLLYSPLFLFFVPGLILFILGIALLIFLYFDALIITGIQFQYHPMFVAALLIIVGYQLVIFALFAKTYAMTHLNEKYIIIDKIHKYLTIEKVSLIGLLAVLAGAVIYLIIFIKWLHNDFGQLQEIKNSIIALILISTGIQTISSSFMLSILGIKEQ